MKFEEVIKKFKEGKAITRTKGWTNIGVADFQGIDKYWEGDIFSSEDILADDWEIVE